MVKFDLQPDGGEATDHQTKSRTDVGYRSIQGETLRMRIIDQQMEISKIDQSQQKKNMSMINDRLAIQGQKIPYRYNRFMVSQHIEEKEGTSILQLLFLAFSVLFKSSICRPLINGLKISNLSDKQFDHHIIIIIYPTC